MAARKSLLAHAKRKRVIYEDMEATENKRKPVAGVRKNSEGFDAKQVTSGNVFENNHDSKVFKPLDRKGRKEVAELRKKKRKPNYDLEKEVKRLWEKMRQRNLEKEERTKLVSEALKKMKGKLVEMGGLHTTSRVLQACIKYCQNSEREAVMEELRPHTLALSCNTYAYHLVIKMLDHANKLQLQQILSILHGQVVSLLRHPVGSAVVEHAYQLANGAQKQELVCEFYSPEYRLFKGVTAGKSRLSELMANEPVSKQNAILEHMTLSLQPVLEKGIIDHSIIHRVLVEYLSVCKKNMVEDVVKSLSGALLVRMIHTKDGAKVGVTCVKLGTAKERKNIIRAMSGHVSRIAQDEHGNMVLLAILDLVDDTRLILKLIIGKLVNELKGLASHKYGRRWLLHLLAPRVPRYFPSDVLEVLQNSPGANLQDWAAKTSSTPVSLKKSTTSAETAILVNPQWDDKSELEVEASAVETDIDDDTGKELRGISKKDASVRRLELLSTEGLGEKLAEVCCAHANELLQSPFGTDIIYEVAMGGVEQVMWQVAPDGVVSVHKAIADLAAKPPVTANVSEATEEHVLEQYHASRTIRRLVLNSQPSPRGTKDSSFSSILWDIALNRKCKLWAKGHSAKVVSAYKTCGDKSARETAEKEVLGLADCGVYKQS